MLYEEFLAGIKARETSKTYEEYQNIERIYNACEHMEKADAYWLWKQTYGKQAQIDRERLLRQIQTMSEYRHMDGAAGSDQVVAGRLLFKAGRSVAETNEFNMGCNAEIITPDGITFRMESYGEVNGHRQMRLLIRFEGKKYGTALVYFCGDFRIHACPENLPEVA